MTSRLFLTLPLLFLSIPIASQPNEGAASTVEAEIRASLNRYVEVFNAGDAEALAQFWTEDSSYYPLDAEPIVGREAVLGSYRQLFQDNPGVKMEIADSTIAPASEGWANESGTSVLTYSDGTTETSPYEAVMKKVDGAWLIQSVVDLGEGSTPPHSEYLQALDWLIGSWKDESDGMVVATNYEWSSNRNSIRGDFSVTVNGEIEKDGIVIIGWDPIDGNIRSWTFDSGGGTAEGSWYEKNGKWYSKALHVLPDGSMGSSTRVFEKVDDNTLQWKAVNRMVDGEMLPNVGPVTLTRVSQGGGESK